MKTPRLFILRYVFLLLCLGACTVQASLVEAEPGLQIMRFDPRAGDPDEPDPGYAMPFDEEESRAVDGWNGREVATLSLHSIGTRIYALWNRFSSAVAIDLHGRR